MNYIQTLSPKMAVKCYYKIKMATALLKGNLYIRYKKVGHTSNSSGSSISHSGNVMPSSAFLDDDGVCPRPFSAFFSPCCCFILSSSSSELASLKKGLLDEPADSVESPFVKKGLPRWPPPRLLPGLQEN